MNVEIYLKKEKKIWKGFDYYKSKFISIAKNYNPIQVS